MKCLPTTRNSKFSVSAEFQPLSPLVTTLQIRYSCSECQRSPGLFVLESLCYFYHVPTTLLGDVCRDNTLSSIARQIVSRYSDPQELLNEIASSAVFREPKHEQENEFEYGKGNECSFTVLEDGLFLPVVDSATQGFSIPVR